MTVDFSTVDMRQWPVLVLKNADGTAIQTIGYATSLKAELCYNEASTITFEVPAYVDGVKTPHYDDIIGMRIIDVVGWGQYILINPTVEKTGIKEVKSCKAYSLEYELTYKKAFFSEDTYNFWNPTAPDETVLGIIMSYIPSWSVGEVDSDLVGKYRTFSEEGANLYNFIKSTVQQTFNCIFDFDTYNRKVNVKSVANQATLSPVYISLDNLAKEINVEEDTENIITRLDVNGADGVDIRSVNPMGSNKIYNLDYFMNETHFSADIITKWNSWKQSFETNQLEYYNVSIERALKTSAILTEEAALTVLEGSDLAQLENSQSVYIEYLASITDTTSAEYIEFQDKLKRVNAEITAKQTEIDRQKELISQLNTEKDALTQELIDIQAAVAFTNFFTDDEVKILDRYFKEDSIEDSSFVVNTVNSYSNAGESNALSNMDFVFDKGTVTKILGVEGKDIYSIKGGTITCSQSANVLSANVIDASYEGPSVPPGEGVIAPPDACSSLVYADGKFVGVMDSNTNIGAYSVDGITWVQTTMASTQGWTSVTYGDGKFVAVGVGNAVNYSTDGITWTEVILPSFGYWYSVTYADGKFVVVGLNVLNGYVGFLDTAFYSTDAITWVAADLATDKNWFSVTYGGDKFVAIGYNYSWREHTCAAAYSFDGIEWTLTELPTVGFWESVVYGDDRFVAVGAGVSAYSFDGITWVASELPPSGYCDSVAYGNGLFVAVNNTNYDFAYSFDGITWVISPMPFYDWKSVAYGDGKFVATGSDNGKGISAYSTDGIKWDCPQVASFILSAYLSKGVYNNVSFPSGCISLTGNIYSVTSNVVPDADAPNSYATGTQLSIEISNAKVYFTHETTEYERYAVEWELYEYGRECLEKLAYPSYSFDVSVANFFALDEFTSFVKGTKLGQKIWLDLGEGQILQPILISADIDFGDPSSLSLTFGDKYSLSDSTFELVDLLEQSVSMGKTVNTKKISYNSFIDSGASTAVKQFMDSALDVSRNAIMSSGDMAISWGSSGIRCRREDGSGGYEPEQIAIINNSICFTDDGWQTAKMAIGRFTDTELGDSWGIVAPNIVGTLIAGQNLVIESSKKDGGVSVFKVDADGASLHNARFDISNGVSHIVLDPVLGFGIGDYPIVETVEGVEGWDDSKVKLWVDTEGNVHFKGNLDAASGVFSGELQAATGTFSGALEAATGTFSGSLQAATGTFSGELEAASGTFKGVVQASDFLNAAGESMLDNNKFKSEYLDLGNIQLDGETGTISMTGNLDLSGTSKITWSSSNSPVKYQFSVDGISDWHEAMTSADKYRRDSLDGGTTWGAAYQFKGSDGSSASVPSYIKSTYIDSTEIRSPTIHTNLLRVLLPEGYTPSGTMDMAGIVLNGYFNGSQLDMFQISTSKSIGPYVLFNSPCWADAYWNFGTTYFAGKYNFVSGSYVDFSDATVTGLGSTVAVFG